MPQFKYIEYKNIQSVGNYPIKIQLDRSPTTLVGGLNGTGKSTFFNALFYGLYGKMLSGAKIGDIINSVNQKHLLVKVEFTERGDNYTVIRGEKPKKFEIYKNDELLNQEAHSRDQQRMLDLILGMDFKLFTQIVLLNKERYVPFMDMTTADRRKVVEDILGISIFSIMNDITKTKIKENQQEISTVERQIDIDRTKLEGQSKLIKQIQESIKSKSEFSKKMLEDKQAEIDLLQADIDKLNEQLDGLITDGYEETKKRKREYSLLSSQFESKINTAKKNKKFFTDNDHCPTCEQEINDTLKELKQKEFQSEIDLINQTVSELVVELEKVINEEDHFEQIIASSNTIRNEISQKRNAIKYIENEAINLVKKSDLGDDESDKLDAAFKEYECMELSIAHNTKELEFKLRYSDKLNSLRDILKDDGVKSVIIKEYINLINKKVNEYLQAMDFYINITLDENFKESFGAINKEKFTMNNLSTGQKTRVNLAIWLALLEIASIKNSVVSNVLMLDEILENIDGEGVGHVMTLFKDKLYDKNIFLVTQRFNEFEDLFRSSIKFKLNEGFTEIE